MALNECRFDTDIIERVKKIDGATVAKWLGPLTSKHLAFTVAGSIFDRYFELLHVRKLSSKMAERRWF